ncbi:MAG: DUF5719 family protein [Candidatus Nanopelagicaceae bacterium]
MKFRRLIYLISVLAVATLVGNLLQADGDARKYSENYPELVCPNIGGAQTQVSLTSSKKLVRFLPAKNYKFVPAKTNRLLTNSSSVIVDGEGTSSMAWISKSGVWAGGVNCLAPQEQQFFVGATADVSSKAKLVVINAGLSSSIVDVITFSESGSFKKTITVGKNQVFSLNVVSLAPGAKSVAMQVIPRTGRVTSYLVDERGRGLKVLGGDIVNSQSSLNRNLWIPGIAHSSANKSHVLRILNPGGAATMITVEVLSKDGRYIPVGLDNRKISGGKVADISFDFDSKQSSFGVRITSDQPIAASVFSRVGADFLWSTAATPGAVGTWAITGLDPNMQFIGSEIAVELKILMPSKKVISKRIAGTDYLTYKLPSGAIGVRIERTSSDTAAALLVSSQSGIGYLPVVNGSTLTRSTVPTANIGVLNP